MLLEKALDRVQVVRRRNQVVIEAYDDLAACRADRIVLHPALARPRIVKVDMRRGGRGKGGGFGRAVVGDQQLSLPRLELLCKAVRQARERRRTSMGGDYDREFHVTSCHSRASLGWRSQDLLVVG